ncbi:hypothetical protein D9M71_734520 [compost metagenome]
MALVLDKLSVSVIGDDVPLDAVANASIAERLVDGVLLVDFHSAVLDGIDGFVAAGQRQGQKRRENDRSQVHVILECFENEREGLKRAASCRGIPECLGCLWALKVEVRLFESFMSISG